jgi:acyl-CoA synthetase (NDP forming)
MKEFFNPKTIALIGASAKRGKLGNYLAHNLKTFKGKIIYINIKDQNINSQHTIRSIKDYKNKIDLVLIASPEITIPRILKECHDKKVKNILIYSKVEDSNYLKKEINHLIKEYKLNVIGPSSFGVYNKTNKLNATLAIETPLDGEISVLTETGSLWSYLTELSHSQHIGFSKYISIGDANDQTLKKTKKYLAEDPKTKQILAQTKREIKTSKKPTVIIENQLDNIHESLVILKSFQSKPKLKGNKLLFITNTGETLNLQTAQDIVLDPVATPQELRIKLKKTKPFDYVIAIFSQQIGTNLEALVKEIIKLKKPVICNLMSNINTHKVKSLLEENKIIYAERPEDIYALLRNM